MPTPLSIRLMPGRSPEYVLENLQRRSDAAGVSLKAKLEAEIAEINLAMQEE